MGLFSLGAYSWWKSNVPSERIARVVPRETWTDLNGYPGSEFLVVVSKEPSMIPPWFVLSKSDLMRWHPETEVLIKKLTIYERYGHTLVPIETRANLTFADAERRIAKSHQRRMSQTSSLHRMILERIE